MIVTLFIEFPNYTGGKFQKELIYGINKSARGIIPHIMQYYVHFVIFPVGSPCPLNFMNYKSVERLYEVSEIRKEI